MKFSRLRLLGFKSFVEPSDFVIERGLTGVVGPNGCGKSNLVEALRWVMGENSYKNMRASGMDDVIFSGSSTRPSRNTAEVTLFLDNADRTAPPSFNDVDELQVSRRIEREAGSIYRINGKEARQGCAASVCRPVDWRAFSFDGGAGTHRRTDPGETPGASSIAGRSGRRLGSAYAPA
jgi:chromosome segregation ATPase